MGDGQYTFRFTIERNDLVRIECLHEGVWYDEPGYFATADLFRAASDAVFEIINSELKEGDDA